MGWGFEVAYKRTCTKGIFSHRRKSERALPVQKTTHKQGKGKNDRGWGRERRLRTHVNLRDPHARAKAAANVKSDTWGDLQRQTSTIAPPLSLSPEGVEWEQKNNNSREKCFALAPLARYLPYAVCRFLGSLFCSFRFVWSCSSLTPSGKASASRTQTDSVRAVPLAAANGPAAVQCSTGR